MVESTLSKLGVTSGKKVLCCSFCGADRSQCFALVAGPVSYICDSCIDLAAQVVADARAKEPPLPTVHQRDPYFAVEEWP